MKVMPRGSSIELAREMVNEVDKNRDGKVDYQEVITTILARTHFLCFPS